MGSREVYADSYQYELVKRGLIPLGCKWGKSEVQCPEPHYILFGSIKIGTFFKLGDDWTYAAA
jgi:hypothetical protein